jgi:hypothetical protein
VRKSALNVRPFLSQRDAARFHKADVIRSSVETQLAQPDRIHGLGDFLRGNSSSMRFDGRMSFK